MFRRRGNYERASVNMMNWAPPFLAVAVIACLLAFPHFRGVPAWLAEFSFVAFLVLILMNLLHRRSDRARQR